MGGTRVVVILLAAIVAVGCGGGGDAAGRPTATPTPSAAPEAAATPSATAAPEAEVTRARGVRLRRVGNFSSPVHVTAPPGDDARVMVVEQDGTIRVVRDGQVLGRPFLDIRNLVTGGGEQGLLSLAFAPDYDESGLFYVYYTDRSGDQRVVEYKRASADRADAGPARLVLRMADSESNHNGGQLAFGPDGLLYIGTGDGGGAGDRHGRGGNAQDLGSLLGKILRIEPTDAGGNAYEIPRTNPFVSRSGARGEIYAYGLRNPWRFSFDRISGALAIGDVGQGAWEEIDYVTRGKGKGANFGWRPFEGRARYAPGESAPGHVKPVIAQSHGDGNCSITGGVFVRDRGVSLYDRYVFGDFCKGRIYKAKLRRGKASGVKPTRLKVSSLSSFGEDARGRVHVASLNGPVYRIAPK
jgi:glucose/arabinose dehydrogenase